MKTANSIFIAALALIGVSFQSCNVLDQPYYAGYEASAFTTPSQIRLAAVGLYDQMQSSNFLGGRAQAYVDARGLDVNPVSYFAGMSDYNTDLMSNYGSVGDAYRAAYRAIFEINLFIEKLTEAPDVLSADETALYLNEARFLRGVVYFYLLNLYSDQHTTSNKGLGVPWIDRSYDAASAFSEEGIVPRATTADVYKKIIEDLTAGTSLPASRGTSGASLYFATSGAAWGMLSRVHLYMESWDAAISAAAKVTGYSLDADPAKTTFVQPPTSSKEIIFWIAHNASDNPGTNSSLGQFYGSGGRADISLSDSFRALFDQENDIRYKFSVYNAAKKQWFTNKYTTPLNSNWAPVIRYAEVILNEAEARAKKASGVDETAIGLVNQIRKRAGVAEIAAADFADKAAFVEFILEERRRELAFEGHGSFDLFRNRKGIPAGRGTASAPAIAYPNDRFALPIPEREIVRAEGVVEQNPGY